MPDDLFHQGPVGVPGIMGEPGVFGTKVKTDTFGLLTSPQSPCAADYIHMCKLTQTYRL